MAKKKNMTKVQKREARAKIKGLIPLLTGDELKRMRKDRSRRKIVGKNFGYGARLGVKQWILSQPDIKNIEKMREMKLL